MRDSLQNPIMNVTGLDISREKLRLVGRSGLRTHVVQGDGMKLPFEDLSQDAISRSHVIEHLKRPLNLIVD